MVKPLTLEFSPVPGERIEQELELRNTAGEALELVPHVMLLGQDEFGGWKTIDKPDQADPALVKRTCVDWVKVTPAEVSLGPTEVKTIKITMATPTGVRGFHSAALIIENKPVRRGSFRMVVRFLVPIRINILGAPAREIISAEDVSLRFLAKDKPGPMPSGVPLPTTAAYLQVTNQGETFGKLGGKILLMAQKDGRWKRVVEAPISPRGIIPGAAYSMFVDLKKRLPTGHYRAVANLQVNGRFVRPVDKELDLEGDPSVTTVHGQVQLELPTITRIDAGPGSTRSGSLTVRNPSDEDVEVKCVPGRPAGLSGVAIGDLLGEDLVATSWLEVRPDTFTLRAGAERNLRVLVRAPATDKPQASYYSDLRLQATHPDGQAAGDFRTLVWVRAPKIDLVAKAEPMRLSLAEQEKDRYVATAQFANVGNTHFEAGAKIRVLNAGQTETVVEGEVESAPGVVLPMAMPEFSGVLDFSKVPAGLYNLLAVLELEKEPCTARLPIRVEDGPEGKVVTILPQTAGGEEAARP
jgi:hypothetical protein